MNRRIKAIVIILVLVCAMTMLSPKSFADTSITLRQRTVEEIMSKYRERPFPLYGSEWVEYEIEPSSSFPYAAGKVKDEYLQEALDALNFIRYLAGLPDDICLDETYIDYTQHGAVLLAALGELTHYRLSLRTCRMSFMTLHIRGRANQTVLVDMEAYWTRL